MLTALAAYWLAYCFIHSFLAADGVKEAARSRFREKYKYYRIGYNGLSTLLLVPAVIMEQKLSSPIYFEYHGALLILRVLLLGSGILLFMAGAKSYNMSEFLGLSQLSGSETEGSFQNEGILSVVRHPWYLGGILILWSRNLTPGTLTTNIILTIYLIVGAFLEEKKLIRKFGKRYLDYRHAVPMLIPRPKDLMRYIREKRR